MIHAAADWLMTYTFGCNCIYNNESVHTISTFGADDIIDFCPFLYEHYAAIRDMEYLGILDGC